MLKKTYKKPNSYTMIIAFGILTSLHNSFSERLKITLFYDKYLEFRTPQL